jgi:hypothetical protein
MPKMSSTIVLNVEKYNDFMRCVTNLKEICNDIDIRDGVVRQRSNDKTSVFEMDLSSILNQSTFAISDLKKKLELLKTFVGQEVTITIEEGENGYFVFSDQYSNLKFLSPAPQFIDNKFMNESEVTSIFSLSEDDLILDHNLTKLITDRIRIITQTFNTAAIQVNFGGETASITAATQAKDQFAKFVDNVVTNVVLENCSANLSTIPFGLDHDENVTFKMYKVTGQPITLNKFTTMLGDVNITIFTRSSLIQDE